MHDAPELPGDDLLAELEESIPQGVSNDTGHRRRAEDALEVEGDLLGLDALLVESVEARDAEAQYKADRESARKGFAGMSKEEVDFCNSRMAAFELAKIWSPEYAVSVWNVYQCACGAKPRTVFSRYMEFHRSRVKDTTTRWLTVKETKLEPVHPVKSVIEVPECPRCSEYELNPDELSDLKELL